MKSSNPVFNRSEEFNRPTANAYGNQTYPGAGASQSGYADPTTWGTGAGGGTMPPYVDDSRMTIDSVVQKTAATLAVVIAFAAATWIFTGNVVEQNALGDQVVNEDLIGNLYFAMMVGSFGAFGLSLVNSFKKVISPGLVLAFAALEGVALGAFSKFIGIYVGDSTIVIQAVVGTFAAFAGTLAAYKFFDIKVGNKFRTFVVAAMFGMVALGLLEMLLSAFGNQIGFFGFGGLGLLFAIGGLVLGVFMLILDFDFIENGIRAGLAERESWRAAFGLTVSLVWIYTNLLRILAIFSQD